MFLWYLLWLALIALAVIVIVRWTRSDSSDNPSSDPLNIAKERYAKGEITRKEYEQLKKDLQE